MTQTADPTGADRRARVEAALIERLANRNRQIGRVPPSELAPLSYSQESLWILSQLAGKAAANNRPINLRLRGQLDLPALEWALSRIQERHDVLRSTFPLVDGSPRQVVMAPEAVSLIPLDWSGKEIGAVDALVARHTGERFDLTREICFRPLLAKLEDDLHLLSIASHHIAIDGWSEQIFISELATLYHAFLAGTNRSPLPELPIQVRDFASWQRAHLTPEAVKGQLETWKQVLTGIPPDLELPSDREITEPITSPIEMELGAGLARSLEALGQRHGLTVFMTLLTGLSALIARYSGQDDIVVAVPTAGRRWVETEPLIGCFVNNVLVRVPVDGNPSFELLAKAVKQASLTAFDNQDVPYSQVVGALRPWASGDPTPLARVHFQLRNFGDRPAPSKHLSIEEYRHEGIGEAHLAVRAASHDGGLRLRITANPERFDRRTIERWSGHLRRMLEEFVDSPTKGIGDLQIVGHEEAHLLASFNPPASIDEPRTAPATLRASAERFPDRWAVIDGDICLTFAQLDSRADRIAAHLRQRGIGVGDTVVVFMERGVDAIASMFGVMRAGAAFVPIDVEATAAWLASLVEETKPGLILTQDKLLPLIEDPGTPVTSIESVLADVLEAKPGAEPSPDDLAYILFTSGSTGRPKGVLVRHRQLAHFIANSAAHRRINAGDRVILFHAISFDGSFDSFFVPLSLGASVVVRDPSALGSIPRFLAWSKEAEISHMDIPTGFFNALVEEVFEGALEVPESIKLVSIGGEQGRADLVTKWQRQFGERIRLANDYGPTETTVWVTTKDVEPMVESMSWLPIGKPSPGCFVYVLDGLGRRSPIGIPGEIHIGGNQVAEGYLNRPDLTAERFVADPWNPGGRMYRSGDLGRWLPNGDLEVLGRLDRQLKIRGFRVEPGEVEAAIRRLEGVADCAVVPTSDGTGERSLVAYVVMEGSHRFDSTILRDRLKQLVPAFLVPAHLIDVPVLPRNLSGKVDFAQLPQPVAESTSESLPHHVVPASPIEISLVEIWTEVLGRHMAANSNFFEEGGHSLLAIRVMSRIQARLGVEIPLSALFTHPTVSELAKVVAEGIAESSGAELESMLDELEAMSDEDATVLLAKLAAEDSSA